VYVDCRLKYGVTMLHNTLSRPKIKKKTSPHPTPRFLHKLKKSVQNAPKVAILRSKIGTKKFWEGAMPPPQAHPPVERGHLSPHLAASWSSRLRCSTLALGPHVCKLSDPPLVIWSLVTATANLTSTPKRQNTHKNTT